MNDQKFSELRTLAEKYEKQIELLSSTLSERNKMLKDLQETYDSLSSKYSEREKLFEQMTTCMSQLKQEISGYKLKLNTLHRERDSLLCEASQLKVIYNSLISYYNLPLVVSR